MGFLIPKPYGELGGSLPQLQSRLSSATVGWGTTVPRVRDGSGSRRHQCAVLWVNVNYCARSSHMQARALTSGRWVR